MYIEPDAYIGISGTVQPYNANYSVTPTFETGSSVLNKRDWSSLVPFTDW